MDQEKAIFRALFGDTGSLPSSLFNAPKTVQKSYRDSLKPGRKTMSNKEAGRVIEKNQAILAAREARWGKA